MTAAPMAVYPDQWEADVLLADGAVRGPEASGARTSAVSAGLRQHAHDMIHDVLAHDVWSTALTHEDLRAH